MSSEIRCAIWAVELDGELVTVRVMERFITSLPKWLAPTVTVESERLAPALAVNAVVPSQAEVPAQGSRSIHSIGTGRSR